MAKVITIAQQKGGAGKTSLAIHLATEWARSKKQVCLIDCDPQGSAAGWAAFRRATEGQLPSLDFRAVEGWKVPGEIGSAGRNSDIVIVDTPPHAETAARGAMRAADLVLTPMQPTPMDLWATKASLEMAEAEKVPALVVFNRVPPRGKVAEAVMAELKSMGTKAATTTLGNRQAFVQSLEQGLGVTEAFGRSLAAQEVKALVKELNRRLARL